MNWLYSGTTLLGTAVKGTGTRALSQFERRLKLCAPSPPLLGNAKISCPRVQTPSQLDKYLVRRLSLPSFFFNLYFCLKM